MEIGKIIIRLKEFQKCYDEQYPNEIPDMFLIAKILEIENGKIEKIR